MAYQTLSKYEVNALSTPRPYPQMYDFKLGKITAADFFSYPPSLEWVYNTSRDYLEQIIQRCKNFSSLHSDCLQRLEDQNLLLSAADKLVLRNCVTLSGRQLADSNVYLLFQVIIRYLSQSDDSISPLMLEVFKLFGRFYSTTRFATGVLRNLKDLLGTHCTSLRENFAIPRDLSDIFDYEDVAKNHLATFSNRADSAISEIEKSQLSVDQVTQMLEKPEGDTIRAAFNSLSQIMDKVAALISNLQADLNAWLRDDSTYVKRLLEVISSENKKLAEVETDIKIRKLRLSESVKLVGIHKKNAETIHARLRSTKGNLKQVNERLEILHAKRAKLQQIIANREASANEKRDAAKDIKQRIKTHQQQRVYQAHELLVRKLERAESDVGKSTVVIKQLQFSEEAVERQEVRMAQMQQRLEEDYRGTKEIYDESMQRYTDTVASIKQQRQEIKESQARAQELQRTISQVKALRQVKMHPESIKKINTARAIADNNVAKLRRIMLQRAFQIAADGIGSDWPSVYSALPFNPERSAEQRNADVEAIRSIVPENAKAHTERDEALIAFNKWLVLHRSANLTEFIGVLRQRMPRPRPDIAEKIQEASDKHQKQVQFAQEYLTWPA